MMNVNSRIDWQAGMELTSRTFVELEECIARKRLVSDRIAGGAQYGIIPGSEFSCNGVFVKKSLEITPLKVMALMPDGALLHIDEDVVVDIPLLYGHEYYLGCGLGKKLKSFDKENVPFVCPEHVCGIFTLEELGDSGLLPLMKFNVNDGLFNIDLNFIPPHLVLESDSRFRPYIDGFAESLRNLGSHHNLESGEAQRSFRHFAFILGNYSLKNRVVSLLELLTEIAHAVEYYVFSPNSENEVEVKPYDVLDVVSWFKWFGEYLHAAETVLDGVVLEDHSIDFEELKAQVKDELYQKLLPELKEALEAEMKNVVREEIRKDLYSSLTRYIDEELKTDLHERLGVELNEDLYTKLYKVLYDGLYDALYVPVVEEQKEEYVPLI